jgi:hypothetical protein
MMTKSIQPTTQLLGALLKSARDIMRNDKGFNGQNRWSYCFLP